MHFIAVLVSLVIVASCLGDDYKAPQKTFEAKQYVKYEDGDVKGSRKGTININFKDSNGADDYVNLMRLDLLGDAKARGYAQGNLMADEIAEFTGPVLDQFIMNMIPTMDKSHLPDWLSKALQGAGSVLPKIFRGAMSWVWDKEEKFVPQNLIDEMEGMAQGICDKRTSQNKKCSVKDWAKQIKTVNMLPELIRMTCTAFGAWGDATAQSSLGGKLLQLRALDFGGGPFANYTVVVSNRNDPSNPDHAFLSVTFPGFVGVITGVAQNGVGVSEKVWMSSEPEGHGPFKNLQKGSYDGEADVFVLRDILEKAKTKQDAESIIQQAKRTWGMWVGLGDATSQQMDLVAYRQKDIQILTPDSAPKLTGQPVIKDLVYVDKHEQPSHDQCLPDALNHFYGKVDFDTTSQVIQAHKTGDLHAAAYDFSKMQMVLAIGKIDASGSYGEDGYAYNRPWVKFDLEDVWAGKV